MKKADTLVLSVVVLVLAGLGYLFFAAPKAPTSDELGYVPVEVPGAQLLEAYVASEEAVNVLIDIPVATFVTVHQAIGDAPGTIIAQSGYMEPGKRMTSMAANPLINPGESFVVLIHVDDGDSIFDIQKDLPIMVDGTVLRADIVAP